jgi:hypothetical protein
MKAPVMILSLFILLLSCKSIPTSIADYEGEKIILGNGGGFTGQVIEYILLENNEVYRTNSLDKSVVLIKKLEKDLTKQIFNNYQVLNLEELQLKQPGNMYFYIQKGAGQQIHEIKWNAESNGEEIEQVKLFYITTLNLIKK